jgi:hypothetical protein
MLGAHMRHVRVFCAARWNFHSQYVDWHLHLKYLLVQAQYVSAQTSF